MVLSAAVLGGFLGDSVPPRHGILAYMGSAVAPSGGDDRRTVLELRVRDPWSCQGVFQHDTRRGQELDGLWQQDVWKRSGDEPSLRRSGPHPKVPTTTWGLGRGDATIPRNRVTGEAKNQYNRSWLSLDDVKSRRFKVKRRSAKIKRAKSSAGENDQKLGAIEPSLSVRERAARVTALAKNVGWKRKAREELEMGFYSSNTSASKNSKRKKITELAEACVGRGKVFPVELTTLIEVAALLRKINMKASEQYLYEPKAMNAEFGFEWSNQLEAHFKMCKRALSRDRGPEVRALELKPQEIPEETLMATTKSKAMARKIGLSFVWAATWMLRAIEAQGVKVGHVKINHTERTVKLWIPKSKMDQRAGRSQDSGMRMQGQVSHPVSLQPGSDVHGRTQGSQTEDFLIPQHGWGTCVTVQHGEGLVGPSQGGCLRALCKKIRSNDVRQRRNERTGNRILGKMEKQRHFQVCGTGLARRTSKHHREVLPHGEIGGSEGGGRGSQGRQTKGGRQQVDGEVEPTHWSCQSS